MCRVKLAYCTTCARLVAERRFEFAERGELCRHIQVAFLKY